MVFIFFAVIGAMAIIGLFVSDMERKRQRLLDLLTRVENLGKKDQARRLRDQNMRRLSMSIFFNGQLQASLDREVTVLEHDNDISPPADSGKRSMFTSKQLQSLEDRIGQLEVMLARDERVAGKADEPPPASPGPSEEESQPPPAQ